MSNKQGICFIIVCILFSINIHAQDFGFGFGDEETGNSPSVNKSLNVSINGEVSASMTGYTGDFSKSLDHVELGDIFSGKLRFSTRTSFAEGIINMNLNPSSSPISLDEAYVRTYFGSFDITAGLRKLTWGKADSFGPLDVINPLDYSGIFVEMADNISLLGVKIARPLVHAAFRFGDFSKIEGVFVPWFQPHNLPREGKWIPSQMEMLTMEMYTLDMPPLPVTEIPITVSDTKTTTLKYAQAGLRYTTTIGSADIGVQYYYGRLPLPSAGINFNIISMSPLDVEARIELMYNPYHQVGIDYAQVLFGFNIRAELAGNITEDLKGDDGSIYNPSLAWSLGFDRDLVWGINLNLQVNESIRLFHDKLGDKLDINNPISVMNGTSDIEGGQKLTATRLTATVSKKFLRDELELRTAAAWGIEDYDCIIMPALIWTKDDFRFALAGGIFAGNSDGQIGQYRDNHFIKISCTYTF